MRFFIGPCVCFVDAQFNELIVLSLRDELPSVLRRDHLNIIMSCCSKVSSSLARWGCLSDVMAPLPIHSPTVLVADHLICTYPSLICKKSEISIPFFKISPVAPVPFPQHLLMLLWLFSRNFQNSHVQIKEQE